MIYFIHDKSSRAIKIGIADDPQKRLNILQVGCVHRLTLLGSIPGGEKQEAKLHDRFASDRIRGEWFRETKQLMEFIDDELVTSMGPFLAIAEEEPEVMKLYVEASEIRPAKGEAFCANEVWYGYPSLGREGLKPRLVQLVGWQRPGKHPVLSSCRAYDIAYKTIYEALPDCRDGCCCQVFNAALGLSFA